MKALKRRAEERHFPTPHPLASHIPAEQALSTGSVLLSLCKPQEYEGSQHWRSNHQGTRPSPPLGPVLPSFRQDPSEAHIKPRVAGDSCVTHSAPLSTHTFPTPGATPPLLSLCGGRLLLDPSI